MTSAATKICLQDSAPSVGEAASKGSSSSLLLDFSSDNSAREYVLALASLLHGSAESRIVVDDAGRARDDFDIGEIARWIKSKSTLSLQFVVGQDGESRKVGVELKSATVAVVTRLLLLDDGPVGVAWFQADPEHLGPMPVLALPTRASAFSAEAVHPLVALGAKTGGLRGARLLVDGEATARQTWTIENRGADSVPVVGAHADSVWIASATPAASVSPAAWSTGEVLPTREPLPDEWWSRFDDLARGASSARQKFGPDNGDDVAHVHDRCNALGKPSAPWPEGGGPRVARGGS